MNQKKLNNILKKHKLWQESLGNFGERANLSGENLSGKDLGGAYLRGAILRDTNLSGADLRGIILHGADLICANLSRADLYKADLSQASLRGADLSGAYLREANLSRADLRVTNLKGAELNGANLYAIDGKKIFRSEGTAHPTVAVDNQIQIGCIIKPAEEWLKDYRKIGKENGYSKEQIKEYGAWIKFVSKEMKREEIKL